MAQAVGQILPGFEGFRQVVAKGLLIKYLDWKVEAIIL